jgi:hypothetical protein
MQIFCSKAYTLFYNICLINLFCFISFTAVAQTNSPVSRFGIGNLLPNENISNAGMGGVSIADYCLGQFNYLNPASYPNVKFTNIQLGLVGDRVNIQSKDSSNITGGVNIAHLQLGMPIGTNGGLAFGLMPDTRVKYNSIDEKNPFDSTIVTTQYIGGGGIQKFYIGYGHRIKNFSFGANVNFSFGNYNHSQVNLFYDSMSIKNTEDGQYFHARGISFNLGASYTHAFTSEKMKGKKLIAGATFAPQSSLRISGDYFQRSFYGENSLSDTVSNKQGVISSIKIPINYGIGVMLYDPIWKIGVDFNGAQWSNYRFDNAIDSTTDTWKLKIGGTYRLSVKETDPYLRRIEYRLGGFTGKDYIRINNTNINNSGITFGLGMPLKISRGNLGFLNLGLQAGARGTVDNGLLKESYTRFLVGISLSEQWFRKQRYD